jgi:hypothetical protein
MRGLAFANKVRCYKLGCLWAYDYRVTGSPYLVMSGGVTGVNSTRKKSVIVKVCYAHYFVVDNGQNEYCTVANSKLNQSYANYCRNKVNKSSELIQNCFTVKV